MLILWPLFTGYHLYSLKIYLLIFLFNHLISLQCFYFNQIMRQALHFQVSKCWPCCLFSLGSSFRIPAECNFLTRFNFVCFFLNCTLCTSFTFFSKQVYDCINILQILSHSCSVFLCLLYTSDAADELMRV